MRCRIWPKFKLTQVKMSIGYALKLSLQIIFYIYQINGLREKQLSEASPKYLINEKLTDLSQNEAHMRKCIVIENLT